MSRRALLLLLARPAQYRPADSTLAPAGRARSAVEELAGAPPPTGAVLMNTICRVPLPPLPFRSFVQVVLAEQVSSPLPIISTSPVTLKLCRCASCAEAVPDTSMDASMARTSTPHIRRICAAAFERSNTMTHAYASATLFERSRFTRTPHVFICRHDGRTHSPEAVRGWSTSTGKPSQTAPRTQHLQSPGHFESPFSTQEQPDFGTRHSKYRCERIHPPTI